MFSLVSYFSISVVVCVSVRRSIRGIPTPPASCDGSLCSASPLDSVARVIVVLLSMLPSEVI